jgi:acyl-CoA thioester hydrolase
MGYCYYGNYAQYFEVGRVEALRSLGFSYKDLEKQGVMLPVSEFTVKYILPAFYDDELTVVTSIVKVEGPKITFDYYLNNADGVKIAEAQTLLVFVKKENMRPCKPPLNFTELMLKHLV